MSGNFKSLVQILQKKYSSFFSIVFVCVLPILESKVQIIIIQMNDYYNVVRFRYGSERKKIYE